MSVTAFFPRDLLKEVDVYHVPTTAGAVSYAGSPDEANKTGFVIPLSSQRRAVMGLDEQGTHLLLMDDNIDLREGDKIVVDPAGDNIEYRVHNVDVHEYGGHPHLEAVIVETSDA